MPNGVLAGAYLAIHLAAAVLVQVRGPFWMSRRPRGDQLVGLARPILMRYHLLVAAGIIVLIAPMGIVSNGLRAAAESWLGGEGYGFLLASAPFLPCIRDSLALAGAGAIVLLWWRAWVPSETREALREDAAQTRLRPS